MSETDHHVPQSTFSISAASVLSKSIQGLLSFVSKNFQFAKMGLHQAFLSVDSADVIQSVVQAASE